MDDRAPQNVLIVARSLKIGGIEKVAVNLANAMADQGHTVHLLIYKRVLELSPDPRIKVHVRDFDKQNRLTIIGLVYDLISRAILKPLLPKSGFFWKGFYYAPLFRLFLRRLERREGIRFDRIIFRGQGAFDVLWPLDDPRAYRVVESFPWILDRTQSRLKQWADSLYLKVLYHRKKIVTVSNGVREVLAGKCREVGAEPTLLTTIHNPCPIDEVRKLAEEPIELPEGPYIVHVGRLVPIKNQQLLIRAFHASGIDAKLVLVGKGKSEAALRALVDELGIADRVHFIGHTTNPYPWMRHARLFVLSSNSEGLGMVLIESLACSTPTVATDCPGGVRDVMIDELADYVVEPTVEALAAALRRAYAAPLEVKEAWVERFSATHIADQFLSLP